MAKRQQRTYRTTEKIQQAAHDTTAPVVPSSKHLARIRKHLKRTVVPDTATTWLDTGSPYLNAVMGSMEKGLAFGRIYEISGQESHGKTALALELAGMAQQQHDAEIIIYDAEASFDPHWAQLRGLDVSRIHLVQPYLAEIEDEEVLVDSGAIFTELRYLVKALHEETGKPIVLLVDSVASLIAPDEAAKEVEDMGMRENASLALFLSRLLRRWVGIARTNNVMLLFINQLREKPGVMFGDPRYTPGGKALPFYCQVRVRMARVKGGRILSGGKPVGAKGVITNIKNKLGHNSIEGAKCGFKIFFRKTAEDSQYVDQKKITRDD